PEASFEVCQKSDYVGSTEYIIRTINESADGSRWMVGTELNLVKRIAEQNRERGTHVHFMSPTICMCSTMFRVDPQHLLWVLESLLAGKVVNQVKVPELVAVQARLALQRMLDLNI
ncbi:MAG: quinolinate synthase NadA, partial [Pseudomonadota bacterium]|nr:quinolinate synthase NadA [Pseudomonadota bacterium]